MKVEGLMGRCWWLESDEPWKALGDMHPTCWFEFELEDECRCTEVLRVFLRRNQF